MNDEQQLLADKLAQAVHAVYSEERNLLIYDCEKRIGLEQAFVFRTGLHLYQLLQETEYRLLDLDSEYNKNHGNAKTTKNFPNGIRPDLILHQRDTHNHNKLAVEFKGWWNDDSDKDFEKLVELTCQNENYKYSLGVFVMITPKGPEFQYFINGSIYE